MGALASRVQEGADERHQRAEVPGAAGGGHQYPASRSPDRLEDLGTVVNVALREVGRDLGASTGTAADGLPVTCRIRPCGPRQG